MVRVKGDKRTLNLLDWEPTEPVVRRFEEDRVRTATLRARIARAVSETLKECDASREEIVAAMSAWLGEDVSKNMLDAYASEAREDHTIPYLRLLALIQATGDVRLLQIGAETFGHTVIDDQYLPWVDVGRLADTKEQVDKAFDMARRQARKGARP